MSSESILTLNSLILSCFGFVAFFFPKPLLLAFLSSPERLHHELITLAAGWGAALLALGYISFMIRNNLNLSSRKVVLQGLLVLYLLLAQGSTHVLANPNTKWSAAPGYALLALQLSFAGLCGYFGLIANEVPPHTARP